MGQNNKNFLVVYFSHSGTTKILAEKIVEILSCDIEEIIELKERKGLLGFLQSGFEAAKEKLTEIKPLKTNIEKYEHIIICSPVWAMNLPPATRTFVKNFYEKLKSVSFFCTMGGVGDKKFFSKLESLCNKKPVICASFKKLDIVSGKYIEKLKELLKTL